MSGDSILKFPRPARLLFVIRQRQDLAGNPVATAAVIPALSLQLPLCVCRVPFCRETNFNSHTGNGTLDYDSPSRPLGPFWSAVFLTKTHTRCKKSSNPLAHFREHYFAICFVQHICCLRPP